MHFMKRNTIIRPKEAQIREWLWYEVRKDKFNVKIGFYLFTHLYPIPSFICDLIRPQMLSKFLASKFYIKKQYESPLLIFFEWYHEGENY